jgi:hypothetical protein
VSLLFMPILRIFCATSMPWSACRSGPSRIGTMTRLLFLCAGPSPVLTSMHIQSACRLLVIHIFWPVIT